MANGSLEKVTVLFFKQNTFVLTSCYFLFLFLYVCFCLPLPPSPLSLSFPISSSLSSPFLLLLSPSSTRSAFYPASSLATLPSSSSSPSHPHHRPPLFITRPSHLSPSIYMNLPSLHNIHISSLPILGTLIPPTPHTLRWQHLPSSNDGVSALFIFLFSFIFPPPSLSSVPSMTIYSFYLSLCYLYPILLTLLPSSLSHNRLTFCSSPFARSASYSSPSTLISLSLLTSPFSSNPPSTSIAFFFHLLYASLFFYPPCLISRLPFPFSLRYPPLSLPLPPTPFPHSLPPLYSPPHRPPLYKGHQRRPGKSPNA